MLRKGSSCLLTLTALCMLCSLPGCNKSIHSGREVTQDIILGDSIRLPLTYTMQELGDFNGPVIKLKLDSSYNYLNKKYLHFIDNKEVEESKKDKAFKKLKKKGIESVEIIPAQEAIELYGLKAAHGAVIIRTKK